MVRLKLTRAEDAILRRREQIGHVQHGVDAPAHLQCTLREDQASPRSGNTHHDRQQRMVRLRRFQPAMQRAIEVGKRIQATGHA